MVYTATQIYMRTTEIKDKVREETWRAQNKHLKARKSIGGKAKSEWPKKLKWLN